MKTVMDVKRYEIEQYRNAFEVGTDDAWKRYRANVKRAVNMFNKSHAEKIDMDMLMSGE